MLQWLPISVTVKTKVLAMVHKVLPGLPTLSYLADVTRPLAQPQDPAAPQTSGQGHCNDFSVLPRILFSQNLPGLCPCFLESQLKCHLLRQTFLSTPSSI